MLRFGGDGRVTEPGRLGREVGKCVDASCPLFRRELAGDAGNFGFAETLA